MTGENIWELLNRVLATPFRPSSRIFWLYLLSGYLLAVCAWLRRQQRVDATFQAAMRYCFPRALLLHPSSLLDYRFALVGGVVYGLVLAPVVVSSAAIQREFVGVLHLSFGAPSFHLQPSPSALAATTILVFIFGDLARFCSHYLMHHVPALWNIHLVHHSAEVLNPVTVLRAHPLEVFLQTSAIALFAGITLGAIEYAYGSPMPVKTVFGVNFLLFCFLISGSTLRHSHIWLRYPAALSHVLLSPAQHQIHHSVLPQHVGRNLGSCLAIWDWMMGSLYVPRKSEELVLGSTFRNGDPPRTVHALLVAPFYRPSKATRQEIALHASPRK